MINWVIIFFVFIRHFAWVRRIFLHLIQADTKIVFYFKTKKLLMKYFLINEIFKFV